jgi:hypothetical protein
MPSLSSTCSSLLQRSRNTLAKNSRCVPTRMSCQAGRFAAPSGSLMGTPPPPTCAICWCQSPAKGAAFHSSSLAPITAMREVPHMNAATITSL